MDALEGGLVRCSRAHFERKLSNSRRLVYDEASELPSDFPFFLYENERLKPMNFVGLSLKQLKALKLSDFSRRFIFSKLLQGKIGRRYVARQGLFSCFLFFFSSSLSFSLF